MAARRYLSDLERERKEPGRMCSVQRYGGQSSTAKRQPLGAKAGRPPAAAGASRPTSPGGGGGSAAAAGAAPAKRQRIEAPPTPSKAAVQEEQQQQQQEAEGTRERERRGHDKPAAQEGSSNPGAQGRRPGVCASGCKAGGMLYDWN
jgi:hypothetical protein